VLLLIPMKLPICVAQINTNSKGGDWVAIKTLIQTYYDAFNAGDSNAMLALLDEDVEHHVNEGAVRHGRAAFAAFNTHMAKCYQEHLTELVIFVEESGRYAAAEFIVNGTYLHDDEGLPPASGQNYRLPAGAFFTINQGKITRVTTYYNLNEWMRQVAG